MAEKSTLPKSTDFIWPLLESMQEDTNLDVAISIEARVFQKLGLSVDQCAIMHDSSRTECQYRLAWARTYAKNSGYLARIGRGSWQLTESGQSVKSIDGLTIKKRQ